MFINKSVSLVFLVFVLFYFTADGYTPTIDDVNEFLDGFVTLVETGDNSNVLSLFTDDNARYCAPICVIGKEAIANTYLQRFANIVPFIEFESTEVTLDDGLFLLSYNAFLKNGNCQDIVSGTNLVYFNDNGEITENYGINKPTQAQFLNTIGEVATGSCETSESDEDSDDDDN